jgi:hypothetical protein
MQASESLVLVLLVFGIINWHQEEIQKLDRKIRKILTIHEQHYLRADIDRLYVPRKAGGRGLMQVEEAYIAETLNFVEYVDGNEGPLIQIVRIRQQTQTQHCYKQLKI